MSAPEPAAARPAARRFPVSALSVPPAGLSARRLGRLAVVLACTAAQAGCSVLSLFTSPIWGATAATASVATSAGHYMQPGASNTVTHRHEALHSVCIEFNPDTNVQDVIPALQVALKAHDVESRVYQLSTLSNECSVWLRYTAAVGWDFAPMGSNYRPYLSYASLVLQQADGRVLASSEFVLDSSFHKGKWASTRAKIEPVVIALLSDVTK